MQHTQNKSVRHIVSIGDSDTTGFTLLFCEFLQSQGLKINLQIVINIDLYFVLKSVGISVKICFFQMVYKNLHTEGIYNPVFPHSCMGIQV